MKNFVRICFLGAIIGCLCLFTNDVYSRGSSGGGSRGFSGGSRSWGGSRSSSSSSSSRRSSWGSSTSKNSTTQKANTTKNTWGNSSPKPEPTVAKPVTVKNNLTGKPVSSAVDRASYEKAKVNGLSFSNRQQAIKDYKTKLQNNPTYQKDFSVKYPTTFTREPAARPSYIPRTYSNRPVVYNAGGYGYYDSGNNWNPLLTYMLIDSIGDAALMSQMSNHGYYVGTPPVAQPVSQNHSGGLLTIVLWILGIGICLFVFYIFVVR